MAAADSAQEFAEGGKKAAALATADAAALGAALESARQEVALLRAEAVAAASVAATDGLVSEREQSNKNADDSKA